MAMGKLKPRIKLKHNVLLSNTKQTHFIAKNVFVFYIKKHVVQHDTVQGYYNYYNYYKCR